MSGVSEPLTWCEGYIGGCSWLFPSIGLSFISTIVEVKFDIGFGHAFVFGSWELACTTGFLIKFGLTAYLHLGKLSRVRVFPSSRLKF